MDEAGCGLRVMRILIDHGCEPGNDYADTFAQAWYDEAGLAAKNVSADLRSLGTRNGSS
jgi:hypothetical protein